MISLHNLLKATLRRAALLSLGPALLSGLSATSMTAQTLPRLVNCGDLNGFATNEPGYELLSAGAAPTNISLSAAPLGTVHVAGNFPNFFGDLPLNPDVLAVDPDQLDQTHRNTSLWLADDTELSISGLTPNGDYRVRLELGASAPWGDLFDIFNPPYWSYLPSATRDMRVEVPDMVGGWRSVASGVRCASGHKGATYATFVGGIVPVWVLTTADATGTVTVRLSTDSSDPVFIAGFELHDHEALPLVYQRLGSDPLLGFTPGVAPFVSAFNAGDFDLAETLATALPDDFERGVALMHLAGWLEGSKHGRLHLVAPAAAALTLAAPSHPACGWLLDELASMQRALDHLAASGREAAFACAEDGGMGFLNTTCADQSISIFGLTKTNANAHHALRELRGITAAAAGTTVLDDLVDWNNGTLAPGDWEPSPLVFAALKLSGATLTTMNPAMSVNFGDPDSVALAARRDAILTAFVDLGFAATDFPQDLELILFREYIDQGVLPVGWPLIDYQNIFSEAQLAASWWADEVALPADDPSAPNWANLLRQQRLLLENIADYWLGERLIDGDLGGGSGDDIELMIQLAKVFAGRQDQTNRRALDALDDMVRHTLFTSGEVQNGYFAGGLTDVEHSAEYTTNTWLTLQAIFGHTAMAFDVGLGVAEHLLYAQNPSLAFAGSSNLGRLHFKSYHFTANGPDTSTTNAHDILLNGRAMSPAVGELGRQLLAESHPMVNDLTDWAGAWRDDAADTTGGKPAGWYGPTQWPTNEFGSGGSWWTFAFNPNDVSELAGGVHSYSLDLLAETYNNSTDPNRWQLLLPAVRMFRSVMDWEDAGFPAGVTVGSDQWAGMLFKGSSRFGPIVINLLGLLAGDTDLNSLADPLGTGGAYVDTALLSRMETWVENEFNGQIGAMFYALGDTAACGAGFTAKSSLIFEGSYSTTIPYYRMLYPLLTTHGLHTDRVPLGGGLSNLTMAASGENLVEGIAYQPLVRWRNRLGDGVDIEMQCNYRDYDATTYSAFVYNFEASPVTSTCQLESGLVPGQYEIEWGAADGKCDLFPAGAITNTMLIEKRGNGTSAEITFAPGLSLLRIVRMGPADQPPAGYDLATDPPVIELVLARAQTAFRIGATVTNPSGSPSPAATLNLYGALMNPDGTLSTLAGQPTEFLLKSYDVPALAPSGSWSVARFNANYELPLKLAQQTPPNSRGHTVGTPATPGVGMGGPAGTPLGGAGPGPSVSLDQQLLLSLLQQGGGLQVRAEVVGDGLESDLLNNDQTRGWLLEDMAVIQE